MGSHRKSRVVKKPINFILGPKIQSKLAKSLFINLEILLQKSCLDSREFTFLKF